MRAGRHWLLWTHWSPVPTIPDELSHSLAELSGLVLSPGDTETTVERVAHLAEGMVRDCDGVGVTLLSNGELTTAACTAEVAREIDAAQYQTGRGPCLDAFDQLQVFSIPSLLEDSSWPAFRAAAIERGIMSSLSLPLTFAGLSLGALNMYSRQPYAFDECREAGLLFAAQAGVALASAQLREASEKVVHGAGVAVQTGDVVGQARAILVEEQGCTPEEALEVLRRRS
ncbi:MAG: GAF and ANTAR domain-containing protein [Actinomycetota bacterium]|nr:GAF and ANTAR domain-containing protein [Actinomycetota bacterium]